MTRLIALSLILAATMAPSAPAQHTMDKMMAKPALDGYCPVCLVKMKKWEKGTPQFAANYDGRTYYFPAAEPMQAFEADPQAFAPVLGGDDVVTFSKSGERVAGDVNLGASYDGRYYFFTSAENKAMFEQSPERFAKADVALGGDCVVCRVDMNHKMPGSEEFSATHNGLRYLFPDAGVRQKFLANPTKYAQAVAGPQR